MKIDIKFKWKIAICIWGILFLSVGMYLYESIKIEIQSKKYVSHIEKMNPEELKLFENSIAVEENPTFSGVCLETSLLSIWEMGIDLNSTLEFMTRKGIWESSLDMKKNYVHICELLNSDPARLPKNMIYIVNRDLAYARLTDSEYNAILVLKNKKVDNFMPHCVFEIYRKDAK